MFVIGSEGMVFKIRPYDPLLKHVYGFVCTCGVEDGAVFSEWFGGTEW